MLADILLARVTRRLGEQTTINIGKKCSASPCYAASPGAFNIDMLS